MRSRDYQLNVGDIEAGTDPLLTVFQTSGVIGHGGDGMTPSLFL